MNKKLLFSSVAAVALCASCSDNILEEMESAPVAQGQERPTVEATVKFGKASDTRLTLAGVWENGDVINAMLMDRVSPTAPNYYYSDPAAWAAYSWSGKYELVNYINTNYPFSYNAKEDLWHAPTRLVEGNYFFTYNGNAAKSEEGEPTYDGSRQHMHELTKQVQYGGTKADMQKAYGDNQYYVGYAKIKSTDDKGAKVTDLTDVIMVPVLNPIGFQIKNIGTETYKINKIAITGSNLASKITIAPRNSGINTASHDEIIELLNARTTLAYPQNNANAIVEALPGSACNYSEVTLDKPFAVKTGESLYIAANVFATDYAVAPGDLTISIFSDKGLIDNVDLTYIHTTIGGADEVLTNNAISDLSAINNIKLQFDDNSIDRPVVLEVRNADDLMQFIGWNKGRNTTYSAILLNDIEITKAITDAVKANVTSATPGSRLYISQNGNALSVAAGADLSVFDWSDDITVNGDITVNSNVTIAEVAEGVTVKLGAKATDVVVTLNNGTIDATGVKLSAAAAITNSADATVKVKNSDATITDGNVEISGVANNITGTANVKLLSGAEYDAAGAATGVLTLTEVNETYMQGAHSKVVASTTMANVEKFVAISVTEIEVSDATISIAKDKDYTAATIVAPKATTITLGEAAKATIEAKSNVSIAAGKNANVTVTIAAGKTATVESADATATITIDGAGNSVVKKSVPAATITLINGGSKKDWR